MRKIIVDGKAWEYRVGGQLATLRHGGRKIRVHLSDITGGTQDDIDRGRHKRTSDGMITPAQIRKYIVGRLGNNPVLWKTFCVFGLFKEPTTGNNFIVVRVPEGRIPWSKTVAPAISRLVRPWFDRDMGPRDRTWNVDVDRRRPGKKPLWELRDTPRYEWDGKKLARMP